MLATISQRVYYSFLVKVRNYYQKHVLPCSKIVSQSFLQPGLPVVVTIAEHASDVASKMILRLSIHRLQIFLMKYEHLQSLQPDDDQGIREKLIKRVCYHVRAILTT